MFIRTCVRFFRRRCRSLSKPILIILCFVLFLQIKYDVIQLLFDDFLINNSSCIDKTLSKTVLNCSGDPLRQWCENEMILCDPYLVVYKKLFIITRSVILQPKFAKAKRLGGEDLQTVLNQPEQDEYFHFDKNFIKLPCSVKMSNEIVPENSLSSIFSSISAYRTCPDVTVIINETTIAIKRQDYANIYHTITDLYTVYLLCRSFYQDPKSVRILFLDAHPKGNLDRFWSQLFHSYSRLGHLKNLSSIFYKELIWSPSQITSELDVRRNRRTPPSFFFDFRKHVLQQFHIDYASTSIFNCRSLQIFFLGRRNYVAHPRNPSGEIPRQLTDEETIFDELRIEFSMYPEIHFSFNHFEQLTIEEQLKIIAQTDIFIGVHGAGLTHVIFQHSNRVFIELVPSFSVSSSSQLLSHYELLASMNNITYYSCSIVNGAPTTVQTIFNCAKDMISQMCPSIKIMPMSN